MPRYFLELNYDGSRYHGWQVQKNAQGIQNVLHEHLSVLFRHPVETTGCGRTDTGVHARQFFAHLDLEEAVTDCENVVHRLNSMLPNDIAITRFFRVRDDLHARFDAISRTYRYYIHFKKDPFKTGRSCLLHNRPDLNLLKAAADTLIQHADFSSFSKSRTQVKTNICRITEAFWQEEPDGLIFKITADRFLRGMVRALVGTMLLAGEKKITTDQFLNIIEGKDRKRAGVSVDACGLYLEEVAYPSGSFRATREATF